MLAFSYFLDVRKLQHKTEISPLLKHLTKRQHSYATIFTITTRARPQFQTCPLTLLTGSPDTINTTITSQCKQIAIMSTGALYKSFFMFLASSVWLRS